MKMVNFVVWNTNDCTQSYDDAEIGREKKSKTVEGYHQKKNPSFVSIIYIYFLVVLIIPILWNSLCIENGDASHA